MPVYVRWAHSTSNGRSSVGVPQTGVRQALLCRKIREAEYRSNDGRNPGLFNNENGRTSDTNGVAFHKAIPQINLTVQ